MILYWRAMVRQGGRDSMERMMQWVMEIVLN
jgi:hypothetical protein